MNLFHALILGVVEGLTEFLPVSSTGHLILAAKLLRVPPTELLKSFQITIQLGAILSVLLLYGKTFLLDRAALARVAAAFLPTAVLGFLFYKTIKAHFLGNDSLVLWALFAGGIFLIGFELLFSRRKGKIDHFARMSYARAFAIGCFQGLAVVPGVSRSAATILGGLALGLERKTTVEFSFLLAVPTMLAASLWDLWKSSSAFSSHDFGMLALGFGVSFVVAWASMRFFLRYVRTHSFIPFGVYRIILAGLFFAVR
jgi:undecaprenyl-diphosphatase